MNLWLVPRRIGISLVILLLQLFLFISADKIYGSYAGVAKNLLIVYMLMVVAVIAITGVKPETTKDIGNFWWFFVFFIFASVVLLMFKVNTPAGISGVSMFWGLGLIQAFVVSYSEETVFRGILPQWIGDIYSNVLFGLFHWAVSSSLWFMLVAIIAGFAFSFIRDKFSIYASMGVHTAWNLKMLGLLDPLLKGMI